MAATKLRTPEPIIGVIVGLCLARMNLSFLEEAFSFITQGLVLMLFLPGIQHDIVKRIEELNE